MQVEYLGMYGNWLYGDSLLQRRIKKVETDFLGEFKDDDRVNVFMLLDLETKKEFQVVLSVDDCEWFDNCEPGVIMSYVPGKSIQYA